MERLLVDPRYRPLFQQLGLKSCSDVNRLFRASETTPSKGVCITSRTLACGSGASLTVFYKEYCFARPAWRFWARPSKARREYQNYHVLEQLDIPCAQRVACGESRDGLGRLQHAFIVTRAVPNLGTLMEFVQQRHPHRGAEQSRKVRDTLFAQLAGMTRRIHQAGFFHNDLYWRNILVESRSGQGPRLVWIDCPRGHFDGWSPWRRRHAIKDLAALDLSAVEVGTRGERLRFMLAYLEKRKLDEPAKRLIHDVVRYRERRWRRA